MNDVVEAEEGVTTKKVHFTVDGDWLADFARTRVLEGRWDHAMDILKDGLTGITTDQVVSILTGEKTLAGNSSKGIRIVKPKKGSNIAEQMAKDMDYRYGNCFRMGDKVWRPYAVVTSWCRDDFHFASTFTGNYHIFNPKSNNHVSALRSLFYANDPHGDMLVEIAPRYSGDHVIRDILCEEFRGSIPFWYKVRTADPIVFIEELLKDGYKRISMRGALIDIGRQHTTTDRNEDPVTGDVLEEIVEEADHVPHVESAIDKSERKIIEDTNTKLMYDTLYLTEQYFLTNPDDFAEMRKISRTFESAVDKLSRHIKNEDWPRVDKVRAEFDTRLEALMAAKVAKQADERGGWFELKLMSKNGLPYAPKPSIRIPLNPFLRWAFRSNFNFEEHGMNVDWDFVAGSGWKMSGDDPAHTDWMLGAGIPLDATYDHDEGSLGSIVRDASWIEKDRLIRQYTTRQFTVLAGDKERSYVSGYVCHPEPGARVTPGSIAVVPNAGPDYQNAMETANMVGSDGRRGLIICETGGKLAHLAIVGREFKCIAIMIPDALKKYKPGQMVQIDMTDGTIQHHIV